MQTANIQELISGKGFIMVNKGLAKHVGLSAATIYGELVSTHLYWKERNKLTTYEGKQWFYCTIEDLEDKTTIKKDSQNREIKKLEKEGLIEVKRFGLPAKRYFHITDKYVQILLDNYFSQNANTDNTNVSNGENEDEPRHDQFSQNAKTRGSKMRKLEEANCETNNKELNNKDFNKKDLKSVCAEEQEIITLLENRQDINQDTHKAILNILNTVKTRENFSYTIFKDTLSIIYFDLYDLNYFKRAISSNLAKGYVDLPTANKSNLCTKEARRMEMTPDWIENYSLDKKTVGKKGDAASISEERKKEIWEQVNKLNQNKEDK